jgi:hypothetical protein
MSVSRRRFLKASAIVSAAFVLKPGTFALGQKNSHSSHSPNSDRLDLYRREMFAPYVGDVFRVRVGKQMVNLKLAALDTVAPTSPGITTGKIVRTDCFSLRFHAETPLPTTARIHHLQHSKLGGFDLFMSQSQEGSKLLHTAIVNHFVS